MAVIMIVGRITLKRRSKKMVRLGDVVLVGYGVGDYPKLRVARVIKLLPGFEVNQKFRIRFIK